MANEYPKTMHHPHFKKGTAVAVQGKDPNSGRAYTDYQGTADRLPPLFVQNAEQEERARAKGYLMHGEAPAPLKLGTEYPLMMVHPDHVDAVPDDKVPHKVGDGPVTIVTVPGKPERFPHVTVNNEAEERAWQAKGYDRPGVCDPAAVERSKAAPYDPDFAGQEWPKMVQTGVGPDGKPIMTLMQDPAAKVETRQYPMWVTTGKDPNSGEAIGKAVDSLEEHIALCAKLGMPSPVAAEVHEAASNGGAITTPFLTAAAAIAHVQASIQADLTPSMTKGEKIAATKARKKAERLAAQQSAA